MAAVALLQSSPPCPCEQLGQSGRRPAASATAAATSTNTSRRSTKNPCSLTTLGASVASLPKKKKVLVPVGMGTEDMEAVILVDVLRRAGADVTLASVEAGTEVVASSGTRLVADVCIGACVGEIFDLIALPGGMPGSARLRDSKVLQEIMCKHAEGKRLYGAICAAPAVVLQPWGLLRRKYMTGHPAFMDKLPTFWAVKSNIQVSGELTTSRGPGTAFEFALSFVHQLFGSEVSDEIGDKLVLIPIAHGSEEMEVVMAVDILRRAMTDVVVASVEKSVKVVASQRTTMVANKPISVAAKSQYDLIILPGGVAGVERMHKSRILRKLLKAQKLAGRVCGAICSSPIILQKQGLLTNEKVTAHPSVTEQLSSHVIDGADVVIDGKLITSKGLGTVVDFSLAIVSKLFGHDRARSVAEGIVFQYPKQ